MARFFALLLILCLAASGVGASESPCAEARTQLRTISGALEIYHIKNGTYPAQKGWMRALKDAGILSNNVPENDPWGNPFAYRLSRDAGFDLESAGPDSALDTSDDQVRANDWAWTACKGRSGC